MYSLRVSIITVCYNSAGTIKNAIESVLSQTYANIEYIIIDGRSTDGTLEIINKYKHRIASVCSQKDRGHIDAMNKGVVSATGDIVYFLNSDDEIYDKDVISGIVKEFMENPGLDLLYGKISLADFPENAGFIHCDRYVFKKKDLLGGTICHQAIFARKILFAKNGLFDTRYKFCADYDWLIRVFGQPGTRAEYIDRYIARYSCKGSSFRNRGILWREQSRIVFRHFPLFIFCKYFMINVLLPGILKNIKKIFDISGVKR